MTSSTQARHRLETFTAVCLLMLGAGCQRQPEYVPQGKIAESSKTQACSDAVLAGLDTFRQSQGLAYETGSYDVQQLFNTGQVKLTYQRDGTQFGCYFGVNKASNGCQLKFFKRSTMEPGHTTVLTGDFGSLNLDQCQCE